MVSMAALGFVGFMLFVLLLAVGFPVLAHRQEQRQEAPDADSDQH